MTNNEHEARENYGTSDMAQLERMEARAEANRLNRANTHEHTDRSAALRQVGVQFTLYGGTYTVTKVNKASIRARVQDRTDRVVTVSFSNSALRDARKEEGC